MKNSVKKLIVSLMAIVLFAYVGITVLAQQGSVSAVTVEFSTTYVNDTYDVNEKAVFPASVEVNYNGTTKTATNGMLVFPSGRVLAVSDDYMSFSEQGEYSLRYYFMDGNVKVTAEKTFKVSSNLYHLTSNSGSITPVTAAMNEASDFRSLDDNTMATEQEGLILRLGEGNEFRYNKPVDLADVDVNGISEIITIDPRIYTFKMNDAGTAFVTTGSIVNYTRIRLTDCYDSSIYLEILLDTSGSTIYIRAGSNTQQDGGILVPNSSATSTNAKEYYQDGVRGLCRLGHGGQWDHGHSYTKLNKNNNHIDGLTFKYDYAESIIYVTGSNAREDRIVNDFKSESIYGNNLFKGFTTGEVFVSIFCDGYNMATESRIDVVSIGKDKGSYLIDGYHLNQNNQNYTRYEDDRAPSIKVDVKDDSKVYCAVGDTFTVPNATAYDVNLASLCETKVYRNYYSDKKININLSNGKFKVDAADTYYIEYSAVDKFGNKGYTLYKVYGVQSETGKSLDINTQKLTSIEAGANTKLPAFSVESVNNPDSVELEIVATCEGKETIKVASIKGLSAINEIGATGVSFMAKYAGAYTISYILKDNVNDFSNEPFEYTVNCVASQNVSFLDAPFLERYIIKNATYGLRDFTAYEFTTGAPVAQKVDAYISFDGGEFTKIEDTNFVTIEGNKTVQIKYAVDENNYVLSNIVDILDVDYGFYSINMRKYFNYEEGAFTVEEYVSADYEKSDIEYIATAQSGKAKLEFINSLFYNKFTLEYKIAQDYGNFLNYNIILTDVEDPTCKTVFTVGRNNNISYLSINGGMNYTCNLAFASDAYNVISYDSSTKRISLADVSIVTDINAPSGKVYFDIEIDGIYGKAGMLIRTVNNQKLFGDLHEDLTNPEISIVRTVGNYTVGEVLTIKAPQYSDVLSPIDLTTVKYSVKYGNNVVTSIDGIALDGINNDAFSDAVIKLDKLGEYSVQYSGCDMMGNQVSGRYFFNAVDNVAPSLVLEDFNEGATYQIKLGAKLVIEYQVSDNITPTEECYAAVLCFNLTTYETSRYDRTEMEGFQIGSTTFYIIEEGLHRINVYCRDAAGNVVTKHFFVMVVA